ncbi:laforin-like [Falco peregrinus]|uniref:laforin-like n=1 Tax=Falco peregrinus TaxID=8954 RepID=UPI00247B0B6C|nr:laforin-like [Falco peregrinus]
MPGAGAARLRPFRAGGRGGAAGHVPRGGGASPTEARVHPVFTTAPALRVAAVPRGGGAQPSGGAGGGARAAGGCRACARGRGAARVAERREERFPIGKAGGPAEGLGGTAAVSRDRPAVVAGAALSFLPPPSAAVLWERRPGGGGVRGLRDCPPLGLRGWGAVRAAPARPYARPFPRTLGLAERTAAPACGPPAFAALPSWPGRAPSVLAGQPVCWRQPRLGDAVDSDATGAAASGHRNRRSVLGLLQPRRRSSAARLLKFPTAESQHSKGDLPLCLSKKSSCFHTSVTVISQAEGVSPWMALN